MQKYLTQVALSYEGLNKLNQLSQEMKKSKSDVINLLILEKMEFSKDSSKDGFKDSSNHSKGLRKDKRNGKSYK